MKILFALLCAAFTTHVYPQSIKTLGPAERNYDAELSCTVMYFNDINKPYIKTQCNLINKSNFTISSSDGIFVYSEIRNERGAKIFGGKLNIVNPVLPGGNVKLTDVSHLKLNGTDRYSVDFKLTQDWVKVITEVSPYQIDIGRRHANTTRNQKINDYNRVEIFDGSDFLPFEIQPWLVVSSFGKDSLFPQQITKPSDKVIFDHVKSVRHKGYWNRLALADFNNDGCPDIVAGTYGVIRGIDSSLKVLLSDSHKDCGVGEMRSDISVEKLNINGNVEQLLIADFDANGYLDIFIPTYQRLILLRNQLGSGFEDVTLDSGIELKSETFPKPEGAEAVDMNFDGKVDIVLGTRIFINQGCFKFRELLDTHLPIIFDEGVKVADLDNDGDFDLTIHCLTGLGCPSYQIFKNDNLKFQRESYPELDRYNGCQASGVNVIDINSDGYQDIFYGASGDGALCKNVMFFVNDGGYSFRLAEKFIDEDDSLKNIVRLESNQDGIPDFAYRRKNGSLVEYRSKNPPKTDGIRFTLDVRDAHERRILQGIALQISAPDGKIMARHVESGGGYIAQNSYRVTYEYPMVGQYQLKVFFPSGVKIFRLRASGEYMITPNSIKAIP